MICPICNCQDEEHYQTCADFDWQKWYDDNILPNGIIGPYEQWAHSKLGIFNIDSNKYDISRGWLQVKEKHLIIGETDCSYVTKLVNSELRFWKSDVVHSVTYISPIGIHKSRLVSWINLLFQYFC